MKGDAAGDITVIERRELSSVPDLMADGATILLFAMPATRTSSASAVMPAGRHFEPVGGRAGVVSGSPEDVAQATAIVQRIADASAKPPADAAERTAARRALVFDELGARLPRVVADGALGLGALPGPATAAEQARIEAALGRTDLPSWVRVDVIQAIAAAKLVALAPALRTIPKPDGAILAAAWSALRTLGVPPSADDLAQAFQSDDPSVRAAAARELGKSAAPDGAARLGKLALADPDEQVRVAATESLGNPRLPEAMPQLEKIFVTGDWTLRQAAGRGINAIGGREAQEAFGRLAFDEQNPSKKYAVTLLMLTGIDKNDPLMVKIAASHPDPDVRELMEHGLPRPHHHE